MEEWGGSFHAEEEAEAKKREEGPERGPINPDEMRLDHWEKMMAPPDAGRRLVPDDYPVVGKLPINRPISDWDEPVDDLLNLLPPAPDSSAYGPAVWGPEAYVKSFEKFTYAKPRDSIKRDFPREWKFACQVLRREFDFLEGSVIMDITATSKNADSTCAYPKCNYWKTEAEYLSERGYQDYVSEYKRIHDGARPKVLWLLFLKKEILKVKKINDSDIRQIICADPIFARIGNAFEEHQNTLMKHRTATRMPQCGWTPFFNGFKRRIERLLSRKNSVFIEFDWTRYDGTIPREIFARIKSFRFSCLAEEFQTDANRAMYQWYCDSLLDRYVLMPSGEVTRQTKGNPSGQISTTMDNNLCNVFFQAFEYAYIHPEKSIEELRESWDRCDSLIYGDDRLTTFDHVPPDYVDRVVHMYKDVFGMWVKPEKVIVSDTPVGLSFCGFTVGPDLMPVPTDCDKLVASLVTPTKKLQDVVALYSKVLCYRILGHNLSDEHEFKRYVRVALEVLARHIRNLGGEEPVHVTERLLDRLWRGGPK